MPFILRNKYSLDSLSQFEKILGFTLILNELMKPFYLIAFGDYKWTNTVPLHACHISSYATGLFLLTRHQRFFDFAYFWGLGGGTMALLTPDVEFTFPDLDFITLFSGHGLLFFWSYVYCNCDWTKSYIFFFDQCIKVFFDIVANHVWLKFVNRGRAWI